MAFIRITTGNDLYKDYTIKPGRTCIGRGSNNDIVLESPSVSNSHAHLNLGDNCFLTDLRSSNGTFINGKKILHAKLSSGDTVNFAEVNATFFD